MKRNQSTYSKNVALVVIEKLLWGKILGRNKLCQKNIEEC